MNFSHITKLEYMLYYQSTPNKNHVPRQIKPGFEEIEVIVSGYGEFINVYTGKPVRFGPGSSVWYYEYDVVEVVSDGKVPYETIVFCYQISEVPEERMPFYSEWDNVQSCNSFCFNAYNDYKLQNTSSEEFTLCTFGRLQWEADQFSKQKNVLKKPHQIVKAISFIDKHFEEDIQMKDIATIAGVSSSHLHLLFRKHVQISPIQYLMKLRLAKAQELLARSSMSVKQICFESGFTDLKNFCSYFKRQNNLTPTQYRLLTSGK